MQAYEPVDLTERPAAPEGFGSADGEEGAGTTEEVEPAGSDPVPIPGWDAGAELPKNGSGAPRGSSKTNGPLAKLEGMYLVRMDSHSSQKQTQLGKTLSLKSRVSSMLLVRLHAEGDQLVSDEVFCNQTYAHECLEGCSTSGWKTSLDTELTKRFPDARAKRTYRVEGGVLTAERSVFALGFDEDDASTDTELPGSSSDDRVWKLGDEAGRIGVRTHLEATIAGIKLNCTVSSVALFATSFEGKLGQGERPLEGVKFPLLGDGSAAKVLVAQGEPSRYCSVEQLSGQKGEKPAAQFVRFKRTESTGCPSASTYDKELPPEPP